MFAWAGAPDKPPAGGGKPDKPAPGKPTKLEVPTGLTCTLAGEQVTATWSPVEGAALYKVMFSIEDEDLDDQSTNATYSVPRSVLTDNPAAPIEVKVRAMRTKHGKGASKPSDAVACQ